MRRRLDDLSRSNPAISENEVLFQLIGTTYGGDGEETFQLPSLGGRVPVHMGQGGGLSNYTIGQSGGVESVTLNVQQIPQHSHFAVTNNSQGSAATPTVSTILSSQSIGNGNNTPNAFVPYAAATWSPCRVRRFRTRAAASRTTISSRS